jgi:carbon monoxide dehydrogenase subunit G
MQLEQKFSLAAPLATVWAAFHDVGLLIECLPGASIDAAKPENEEGIALTFRVKLGPIAAGFAGRGRMTLDETEKKGGFSGGAVDAKTNSRVKGEAGFALTGEGAGTLVTVTVNFAITGALAQFSREGIVRALAETLTKQFADNLQARLPQAAEAPLPGAAATPEASAANEAEVAPAAATLVGEEAPAPPAAASPAPASTPAPTSPAPAKPAADTSTIDLWTLVKAWWRGLWAKGGSA